MEFPGKELISDPVLNLRYEIEIEAEPGRVWPWLKQVGYHRGGWYIDSLHLKEILKGVKKRVERAIKDEN